MITRDLDAFSAFARRQAPDFGPACARGAFLVSPEGLALAEQSAQDNRYMAMGAPISGETAHGQHRALHASLSAALPTLCFPGHPEAPDGLFPNNVFATTQGRLIIGHMRHPVRQREAERHDICAFFTDLLGYDLVDLRRQAGICELTGALVIDRARGLGFCGLSQRCDVPGAHAMHEAFGLRATLMFDLAQGEYHTNVLLSVLAGRALAICPDGFADPAVVEAIAALYAPRVLRLGREQQAAFAGNCIALADSGVWMSARGADSLLPEQRQVLRDAGFRLHAVALDEIEKAGGSLRCCVAEIF